MPTAALRPCVVCKRLGCTEHVRQPFRGHGQAPTRIRGRRLKPLREALLAKQGERCAKCGRLCLLSQVQRDHIINIKEGGQDIQANCQMLCLDCHKAKTQQEAQRGQARHR